MEDSSQRRLEELELNWLRRTRAQVKIKV